MMNIPPSSMTLQTWRALLGTRRALPILGISGVLLAGEHSAYPGIAPMVDGIALCLSAVLLAPLSFRLLFPHGLESPWNAVRLLIFAFLAVGVVFAVADEVPALLGVNTTFWSFDDKTACVALFMVGGWGLGRDVNLEAALSHEQGRANAAEREVQQAQLLAIRSHLDPHFLFNTLNAIAEWCRQDGEVAEGAVLRLAEMLRMVLAGVKAPSWPLSQELQLLQSLWALHLLRDPNLFTLRIDSPEALSRLEIPPMILLPLAENAVKHGPAAGFRGEIVLTLKTEGSRLRVTLDNPGPYAGPREGSDGLPTVQRRLEVAYGREARLHIGAHGMDRTQVSVELPLQAAPQVAA